MREFAITIYLLAYKLLFTIFKLLPLQNKVTFLISFIDNPMAVYGEIREQNNNFQTIFLCNNPRITVFFEEMGDPTYALESKNIAHTIKGIYHLATSKHIIADNYYGFLAVTKFKRAVTCTQIWHAVGAIKQFGAMDASNTNRTRAAIKRFHKVYNRFDQFVVGSDLMADIFKAAMPAPTAIFLKTGVPRTDFFFDEAKHQEVRNWHYRKNNFLQDKKIILYAPTFRKDAQNNPVSQLNLEKMYVALKDDYVLLIKQHPGSKEKLTVSPEHASFVFDYSDEIYTNDLLIITDILITDYSSLPMEFVFRKQKMIFYAYDLDSYQKENGLWEDYEASVPGPVVRNADEMIDAILNQDVNLEQLDAYAQKWIQYCDGKSSESLVNHLLG